MLSLAAQMLRHRKGSAVATVIALAVGVSILMAMGLLIESGLRFRPAPQRFAAVDVVVADRTLTLTHRDFAGETNRSTVDLPERGTLPAALVDQVRQVPGVASAVADLSFGVVGPAGAATGHGWSSAALAGHRIVDGQRPTADNEIAVAAGGALRTGVQVELSVGGVVQRLRVSGLVDGAHGGGAGVVFFTDAKAAALSPRPGRVDAVGVMIVPGADRAAVSAAVGRIAVAAGAEIYTGADRGRLDESATLAAGQLLIQLGASFGGYVAMLVMFVVAGTIGLAVRHRRRDLALLRAIAATPGQVIRMVLAEVGLIGVLAVAVGVPVGLLAARWVMRELVHRGFVPDGFPIAEGAVCAAIVAAASLLVAMGAALLAARRTVKIRPTEALGEIAVESGRNSKVRLICGLITVAGGAALTFLTTMTGGMTALTAAIGLLYTLVLAVALLGPWINRGAARLLAPLLRIVWGTSGYLAAANLRANAKGMVTVLTALVLSVGFGGSVWFLQDNLQRQTVVQTRDGLLADHALVSATGLPESATADLRRVPGVTAATAVQRTTIIATMFGDAQPVPAQAIDPDGAERTMALNVHEGSLADLHGDSIAISDLAASSYGWRLGQPAQIWLGDGAPVTVRVVAVYTRGLGFGDVTLTRQTVAGHTSIGLADRVLMRTTTGADVSDALAGVVARYPGSAVVDTAGMSGQLAKDLALTAWLNKLLITVMVAYAALAAANTMVMAALARGRELALLRLVGVTRRQVKRMVHAEQAGLLGMSLLIGGAIAALTLISVVRTLTGQPIPYIPPLGLAAIIGGTTLLALLTTILPIGRLLRVPPVAGIGIKE